MTIIMTILLSIIPQPGGIEELVLVEPVAVATTGATRTGNTVQETPTMPPPPTTPPWTVWDSLAECESGGNWSINTGNGYYGGLQFSLTSWRAVGGTGYPHHHSREEQIFRAEKLLDIQGWGAWPACSRKLGLR
jgi:hypothetical protein